MFRVKAIITVVFQGHFSMRNWNNLFYTHGKNYIIPKYQLGHCESFPAEFSPVWYIFIVLYAVSYIMAQDAVSTSHVFLPQTLESGVSPRICSSFRCRVVFRNQDLSVRCSHCYQRVLASRPFHCMYLYVHPCVYVFICMKSVCMK